jgi:hypothetical protein
MCFPVRKTKCVGVLAVLVVGILIHSGRSIANAQERVDPGVIAIPEVVRIVAGTKQFLPVSIKQTRLIPKLSILLIQGLTSVAVLSRGRLFESGVWALRLNDLEGLEIEAAANTIEISELKLSLVTLEGSMLAEKSIRLIISPPFAAAVPPTQLRDPSAETQSVVPIAAQRDLPNTGLEEGRSLMARGDTNLSGGKIHVARLFYRRAAESGWPPGALALAQTYDPHELEKLAVAGGVRPDAELAKSWYRRASEMGLAEAETKLRRLGDR